MSLFLRGPLRTVFIFAGVIEDVFVGLFISIKFNHVAAFEEGNCLAPLSLTTTAKSRPMHSARDQY
jgi:hypothetical protein